MSIEIGGYSANTKLDNDAKLSAKVVFRPGDWSPTMPFLGGGAYQRKVGGTSGAATPLSGYAFEFRHTNDKTVAAIRRVSVMILKGGVPASTVFMLTFKLWFARFYTANGSGGVAYSGANSDGKSRDIMPPTTIADIRATTSTQTGLVAGTWQLDADPITSVTASCINNVTAAFPDVIGDGIQTGRIYNIWHAAPGDYPIVCARNEGIAIEQVNHGVGGAGNVSNIPDFNIEYDEVPAS